MNWIAPALTLAFVMPASVADWSQWRGPALNGSAEVEGLPERFGPEENVVWKAALPGSGAGTPVVMGGRIFLTAMDEASETLLAMCLDRKTGKELWVHEAGRGRRDSERSRGRENNYASCSPVTDGRTACFLFGSGDLLGFDVEGELLWERKLVESPRDIAIQWGYASSPLLHDGRLYVQMVQRAESYVLAVDPRTGKDLWRVARPNEARAESQEAYTTPMPFRNGERLDLVVLGADCLTGHDPATGKERWRWCGLNPRNAPNMRAVASPVVGEGGLVYVISPQHNPLHALRIRGDEIEEAWTFERPTPDSTTPLLYRGRMYALDGRRGRMVCLDPAKGTAIWQADLDTPTFLRASPTGADGRIYVMDAEGTVVVLAAGDEHEELWRVSLDSYPSRSTIVADGQDLLVRTADTLWCFGRR